MTVDKPIRILCVDDEENVLYALERVFMDDGYEIVTARSGEEGLRLLEKESHVQIVISDFRMPGMNGVEFLQQVWERQPETIRIVLSGFADTAAVVAAINEGHIYKFVPKPWNDDELRVTVATSIESYELKRKNELLAGELQERNAELQAINDELRQEIDCGKLPPLPESVSLPFLGQILEQISVGIVMMDDAGAIRMVNPRAAAWLGRREEEIAGANRRDLLPDRANRLLDRVETGEGAEVLAVESWDGWEARATRIPGRRLRRVLTLIVREEAPRA